MAPPAPLPPHEAARFSRLRWTGFALVAAGYVLSFFHRVAPGALAADLRAAFAATGAELGALAATYFTVYTVMQVPTGVLVDTLGPRRVVALGGLVAGAGSVLFGQAPTLPVAGAGRALVGLGVSVTFVALLKLVTAWFDERRFASVSGLVILLGNVGAILAAAPLAAAVAVISWRTLFAALGLLSAAGGVATWLLVHDRPSDAGLADLPSPGPAALGWSGGWWSGLAAVAGNGATWPGFFVNLGLGGAWLSFAGLWAVPILVDGHGLSRGDAALHVTVGLAGFALAAFGVGLLSDRLGRRRPLLLGLALAHVACWAPWALGLALPGWASLALFGLMGLSAASFTLTWTAAKEVNPAPLAGMAIAVVNTGVFLGPVLYQPLVGRILDRTGDTRLGAAALAAAALGGLLAALFLRESWRGPGRE